MPVGDDQRQHLELTRDLAGRFNSRYGETFVRARGADPQRETARIYDLQDPTAKMSKSADVDGRPREAARRTRRSRRRRSSSAVTDTEREVRFDPEHEARHLEPARHLAAISGPLDRRRSRASTRAAATATSRRTLAEAVVETVRRRSARARSSCSHDPAELDRLLAVGAEKADRAGRAHPRARVRPRGLPPPTVREAVTP